MNWEERLRELARSQEGLVGRCHLSNANCSIAEWQRARENGRWDSLSTRVIRLRGSPSSDAQRVLAAVLDASPGAVLHGQSALAWFGFRGYTLQAIEVARPNGLSGALPQLAKVRRLRHLRAHDVVVVGGVPTETPLRAIWVEAARYAAPHRVEMGALRIGRLLDDAHRRGLVTWEALHEMVGDIRRRGRAGTVLMRRLAEVRTPGSSPTESRNEDQFEQILTDAGLPSLHRQVVVGSDHPIGRVDFRDEELPLAVEVNSLTFHTTPSDRAADELRYVRLNDAGFCVAVIWEDDLWSNSGDVVRTIVRARTCAKNGTCSVLHSPGCPWPIAA